MKKTTAAILACIAFQYSHAQTVVIDQTSCTDKDVQFLPALYYNHSKSKYGKMLYGTTAGFTAADDAKILSVLNQFEQLEERSRKNFQATGCVMRVSYSKNSHYSFNGSQYKNYGYQLGLYRMVCHVQQHLVKEVGEYRSVLRINVNPAFTKNPTTVGTGSLFVKTPGTLNWTYDFPADAMLGPNYENDRINKPSQVSKYFTEQSVLQGRSDNYKDYHTDFLTLNNGNGYVETWLGGARYDKHPEGSYQWIDRHYLITKPGVPLFIAVSRKQYLKDMLEYLELEKANLSFTIEDLTKRNATNNSTFETQKRQTWQAHKAAYTEIYEARKAKLKELLATKSEDWLQQQAIVAGGNKTKDVNDRLKETGKFYDKEEENIYALYVLNPAYWSRNAGDPIQPVLFEIQFRYEISTGTKWSENLLKNFEKNFDFEALRKMLK